MGQMLTSLESIPESFHINIGDKVRHENVSKRKIYGLFYSLKEEINY